MSSAVEMDSQMDDDEEEAPYLRPFPFETDPRLRNSFHCDDHVNTDNHSPYASTLPPAYSHPSSYSAANQFAHLYRPLSSRMGYDDDDDDNDDDHHHHHHHRHYGGRRFVSSSRPPTSMRRSALSRLRGQEEKRETTPER